MMDVVSLEDLSCVLECKSASTLPLWICLFLGYCTIGDYLENSFDTTKISRRPNNVESEC